jgi:hypothetical protein
MHRFEIWTLFWNIVCYLSLEFTFIKLIKKAFSRTERLHIPRKYAVVFWLPHFKERGREYSEWTMPIPYITQANYGQINMIKHAILLKDKWTTNHLHTGSIAYSGSYRWSILRFFFDTSNASEISSYFYFFSLTWLSGPACAHFD